MILIDFFGPERVQKNRPFNIPAGFAPNPPGGDKKAFWTRGQMGKKTAPDPSKILTDYGKLYLLRVLFPPISQISSLLLLLLPNLSHFITFGMVKSKIFGATLDQK